ncbi:MAG: hypothetical protein Q9207_008072 [Kuettlingeria erythrocarpa]
MAGAPIVVSPSESWDGNDGPWSTFALGIGTPPQYVRVLISTTCPQPWAVDPRGCIATDPVSCAADRGGLFDKNQSSTWAEEGLHELHQQLNLGYAGNGDWGRDSIALGYPGSGAISVENQLLATIATKDFYIATWGIAPRPTNLSRSESDLATFTPEDSYQSLLSKLKQENKIPSLAYGYTAGARYRLKRVPASLTLGGYDTSRFVSSNLTFGLAGDNSRDLVAGIQSISVIGTSQELLPTPILAFVDSTVPHIWLPIEACRAFEEVFGIDWDPSCDLYLVNETTHQALLAQNASLSFKIGTNTVTPQVVDIILPYASFDLQVLDTYPNVTNSTRYFPLRRAANDTQYTLGRTFLQETYLIADYERSTFSLNQCRFVENDEPDIRPIFPPNTNTTNTTGGGITPLNTYQKRDLSPGIIAAIAIGSLVFLAILLSISTILWLRGRKSQLPHSDQSDQTSIAPETPEPKSPQEVHTDPIIPPELEGIGLGPREMEDGVAATEMNAIAEERHELYG